MRAPRLVTASFAMALSAKCSPVRLWRTSRTTPIVPSPRTSRSLYAFKLRYSPDSVHADEVDEWAHC